MDIYNHNPMACGNPPMYMGSPGEGDVQRLLCAGRPGTQRNVANGSQVGYYLVGVNRG